MKKYVLSSLMLLMFSVLYSQGNMKTRKWRPSEVDSLQKAQMLFEESNYVMALPIFEKLYFNHPKETYLKYVYGICGLYRSDMHENSLELLSEVYLKNKKIYDIEYDLARANHFNYKFDEALILLEKYMSNKKLTPAQRKNAELVVNYCNNGKTMLASPVDAKIENIGDGINSTSSEYVPVISSDESVMIFTYRGDQSVGGLQNAYNQPDPMGVYYEDVFISNKENDNWSTPRSIGENINTTAHDAAIALSNDGQKLFIFRDNRYDGGDIYMSVLDGINWSTPEKLRGDINSAAWEGSCALSADEKTLYFSSEKPGGLGGKDLYKASLMPDGTWSKVQSLGDVINTPFDDDAPFIHPDGKTLIYSSKGFNSMGGFDIFKSELNTDSTWSQPVNLGYPINTPDDDIYFVLSANGKKGYYASGKKGGFGLQDIYTVDMPDDFIAPILAMLKGTITIDDKPSLADITVYYGSQKLEYASIKSNSLSGDYLINLRAGENYTIKYRTDGFPPREEQLNLTDLKTFLEKVIDVKFFTAKDTVPPVDSINLASILVASSNTENTTVEKPKDLGNSSMTGLEFKVQIAAYNLPKNYRYEHLRGLGKVEKLLLDDGITRFTIGGSFNTLNEANAHNQKVRAAGQTDAFVTAIYNGKRVYLEDLEKLGLIPSQK